MPLEIRISPRAAAEIEMAAAWWQENRPSAPGAVRVDIARTLALLSVQPGLGAPIRKPRVPGARRYTLDRIRYYLYYCVDGEILEVLALWHASRGSEPRV